MGVGLLKLSTVINHTQQTILTHLVLLEVVERQLEVPEWRSG